MSGGNHLLIGDGAALAAIALRLRDFSAGARVIVLAEADGRRPCLDSAADVTIHWVDPVAGWGPRTLNDALRGLFLPQDALDVWVACEARQARLICDQLTDDHGVARHRIEAMAWLPTTVALM